MDVGTFSLLGLAGALGTWSRYGVGRLAQGRFGALPLGTLSVNLVGSFAMALLSGWALSSPQVSAQTRLVLGTGFLGGFTTYSAFNQESLNLLGEQKWLAAAGYVLVTVLGSLLAGGLGLWLGRRLA